MRILYVTDFGFDVLAQSLLSGLVECGIEVVDYPYNPIFHGGVETWDRAEVRQLLAAAVPSWLPSLADAFDLAGAIASGSLIPQGFQGQYTALPKTPAFTERDVSAEIAAGKFDVAVLVVGYVRHRQAVIALARLADRVRLPPVVVVDFWKVPDVIRWEVVDTFRAVAVFKNIMTRPDPRVTPLPLSSALAGKGDGFLRGLLGGRFRWDRPKKYDVHCNLSATYPLRKMLSDEVDRICKNNGLIKAPVGPYGENLYAIHESRIAFTMRGSEPDTLHYWEIPAFKTAMFCDGTMGAIHPEPFEDGKTAVFYDPSDLSGLETLVTRYLKDDRARETLAEAGMNHCARHHSNRARAAYFLEKVKNLVAA